MRELEKPRATAPAVVYRTKTVALHRLGKADPSALRVVRHELDDGHELLCFYLGAYSFHQPTAAVDSALLAAATGSTDRSEIPLESIDFETTAETDGLELSLSQATGILREHGLEPNDYLDATTVEDFTWGTVISTTFAE